MGLMPDPKVARFFNVCQKTIDRWSDDPELNFPPRIDINGRGYRDTEKLDAFVAGRLKASVIGERAERRKLKAPVPSERAKRRKQQEDQHAGEAG
jgi:hypothetical protein